MTLIMYPWLKVLMLYVVFHFCFYDLCDILKLSFDFSLFSKFYRLLFYFWSKKSYKHVFAITNKNKRYSETCVKFALFLENVKLERRSTIFLVHIKHKQKKPFQYTVSAHSNQLFGHYVRRIPGKFAT